MGHTIKVLKTNKNRKSSLSKFSWNRKINACVTDKLTLNDTMPSICIISLVWPWKQNALCITDSTSFSPLQFFLLQSTVQTSESCDMCSIPSVSLPWTVTQLLKHFLGQQCGASSGNYHQCFAQGLKCQLGFHIVCLSEQAATNIKIWWE